MNTEDDFIKAIGKVSIMFALLDYVVSTLLLRMVGWVPGSHAPFNDNTTLGQKFELLEKLAPQDVINEEILVDLRKYLPSAKKVACERNRYMHDQWIFDPKLIQHGRIGRHRPLLSLKSSTQEVLLEDMYRFAREIGDLQRIFVNALNSLDASSFVDKKI